MFWNRPPPPPPEPLPLSEVPVWKQMVTDEPRLATGALKYPVNDDVNCRLSLWRGDITRLQVDAIVNAANNSVLGGGGVDGAIHSAAGRGLFDECLQLPVVHRRGFWEMRCLTGDCVITGGHRLPAKNIIHTVGPVAFWKVDEQTLKSCYFKALELAKEKQLRTIAFCCISTGVYGYPPVAACNTACSTVRQWLEQPDNLRAMDRVIFCTFSREDHLAYEKFMHQYFPVVTENLKMVTEVVPTAEEKKSDAEARPRLSVRFDKPRQDDDDSRNNRSGSAPDVPGRSTQSSIADTTGQSEPATAAGEAIPDGTADSIGQQQSETSSEAHDAPLPSSSSNQSSQSETASSDPPASTSQQQQTSPSE